MLLHALGRNQQFGAVLVRVLEVQVSRNETVFHHQHRVHDFAGTCHPHLVTGLALRGSNFYALVTEDVVDSLGLVRVANVRRSGVGVDIAYLADVDTRALQSVLKRLGRTFHIRTADVVSVATEAPSDNLCQNRCSAFHCVLILFEYDCSRTTARNESVTVTVKRTRSFLRSVLTSREGADAVERTNGERIHLLCATADNHVLQAVLDKQRTESDRVASAGTCSTDCQVDTLQVEDATQVHRHRRVHRLEDCSTTAEGRVFLLTNSVHGTNGRVGRRVVAVDKTYVVRVQIVLIYVGVLQCIARCPKRIFSLLGHKTTLRAAEFTFQVGNFQFGCQCATETHFLALRVEDYA